MPESPLARAGMVLAIASYLLAASAPVKAHHAFAADLQRRPTATNRFTIKGTVTKFQLVNPHSWLYLAVKNRTEASVTGDSSLVRPSA